MSLLTRLTLRSPNSQDSSTNQHQQGYRDPIILTHTFTFTDGIATVEAFLESLRRPSLLALNNKFTDWDQLFSLDPKLHLVKDGTLSVPKERRYLLRCMELFRMGLDPKDFSVGPRKPKKFRGWGPRVQHGKRLRGKPTE
ncbi:hypothetical protein PSTT_07954 [Puccinia striiformis]|uniref:Small ribosomal subunit protein mS41 n=1 Tax=Puccinia striiformis TaxID=27350 RepID=A0A2S4VEE7_9BASI|nr:hypothetical protein PSTT_07954 [Puccinia striiformis]